MSEIPDILRIARKISCGDWRGFADGFSLEQLADGTELFCHASLLCENSTEAVSFMEGLSNRLLGHVQPDGAALFLQTLKRLQDVRDSGGWLQIVENEDEEELISLNFPKDAFPDAVERYCDSVAANVQVDRAMICAAVLATSALCMQGRYMVAYPSGNGHREHLCLYVVIIANPGERKSSVFAKALSPVRAWQNERREQYKLELAEYKTKVSYPCCTSKKTPNHPRSNPRVAGGRAYNICPLPDRYIIPCPDMIRQVQTNKKTGRGLIPLPVSFYCALLHMCNLSRDDLVKCAMFSRDFEIDRTFLNAAFQF